VSIASGVAGVLWRLTFPPPPQQELKTLKKNHNNLLSFPLFGSIISNMLRVQIFLFI
jgi:hypothetical protein